MVVPTARAVTNPVELTEATNPFEEVQGFDTAGVAEPVSCDVPLRQAESVPEMVGNAFTVISAVV